MPLPSHLCVRQISPAWPRHGQKKGAVLDRLEIVRFALIERDEPAGSQIERSPGGIQPKVPLNHVDRNPSVRSMLGDADARAQRGEHDTKALVLDEGSRVPTGRP